MQHFRLTKSKSIPEGIVLGVSAAGNSCWHFLPILSFNLGEPSLQCLKGADLKHLRPHIESLGGKVWFFVHYQFVVWKSFKLAHWTLHLKLFLFLKQVDRGTDDRAVKIALVKSNLAREDLPEDLSEIVFPVSAMFTCFYFKSSPFTLRTNGASIFPARLLAPRCGASLRDCVDRTGCAWD